MGVSGAEVPIAKKLAPQWRAGRAVLDARGFLGASTVRAEPAFKLTGPGSAALAAYESRLPRVGFVL